MNYKNHGNILLKKCIKGFRFSDKGANRCAHPNNPKLGSGAGQKITNNKQKKKNYVCTLSATNQHFSESGLHYDSLCLFRSSEHV